AYRERQRELAEEARRKIQEEGAEQAARWQERQAWYRQGRGKQQARRGEQRRVVGGGHAPGGGRGGDRAGGRPAGPLPPRGPAVRAATATARGSAPPGSVPRPPRQPVAGLEEELPASHQDVSHSTIRNVGLCPLALPRPSSLRSASR